MSNKFTWGEHTFASEQETCKAISALLADHLCDGDAGSVEHNGKTYNIEVCAYLINPDTGERVIPPAVRPLDPRELATVLAALRQYQGGTADMDSLAGCREIEAIATDGGTLKPLDAAEIDALCERLNR